MAEFVIIKMCETEEPSSQSCCSVDEHQEEATSNDTDTSDASVCANTQSDLDLKSIVRKSCGLKKQSTRLCLPSLASITIFATHHGISSTNLKYTAKDLGLVITHSGSQNRGRIWFGLSKKIRSIVSNVVISKVCTTLFRFNQRKDGFYYASARNEAALQLYGQYRDVYEALSRSDHSSNRTNTISSCARRMDPKVWSSSDVDILIEARSQDHPQTFRQIAWMLNRTSDTSDRKFKTTDCMNKWLRMFPSSMDASKTLEYIRNLQRKWPGLIYKIQTEQGDDVSRAPSLIGLHIVWPWTAQLMKVLTLSIFCDATYKVTIYHYKVVCITTLDGNKHHRPLMVSFITHSTAEQWCKIFNLFAR